MGSSPTGKRWSTPQNSHRSRRPPRNARRLRPPHAGLALRIRIYRRTTRPRSLDRRRGRRRPSPRHDRDQNSAAGARSTGRIQSAKRTGLAALHRANAGRHPRRHARHRQSRRDQFRFARRGHSRREASRDPRSIFANFAKSKPRRVLANPDPSLASLPFPHFVRIDDEPVATKRQFACEQHQKETRVTIGILGRRTTRLHARARGLPARTAFSFPRPIAEAPVGRIASRVTADFRDESALEKFANGLELVTYEFENVPVARHPLPRRTRPCFHPAPKALEIAQDRISEKTLFQEFEIPTTKFAPVHVRLTRRRRQKHRPARRPQNLPHGLRRQRPVASPHRRDFVAKRKAFQQRDFTPQSAANSHANGNQPNRNSAPLSSKTSSPSPAKSRVLAVRSRQQRNRLLPARRKPPPRRNPSPLACPRAASRSRTPAPGGKLAREVLDEPSTTSASSPSNSSNATAASSPTKWPPASTTPATGPSKARSPANSKTISAPLLTSPSAQPSPSAPPPCSTSSATRPTPPKSS